MSLRIRLAIGLVLLLAGLQWAVPRQLSQLVAERVQQFTRGPLPLVRVTTIPFWIAGQGKFQDIYLVAHDVHTGALVLSTVVLNWQNGQLSVSDLWHQRIKVLETGTMTVTVTELDQALSDYLNQSGRGTLADARVEVRPGQVTVSGQVRLGQVQVPLTMDGRLGLSSDRTRVLFYPATIDGLKIPLQTQMVIFRVQELALPIPLLLTSIRLLHGGIALNAGT